VDELDRAGVPLFAITNFSADFWAPFVEKEQAFFSASATSCGARRRAAEADPAIYWLALDRFKLQPSQALLSTTARSTSTAPKRSACAPPLHHAEPARAARARGSWPEAAYRGAAGAGGAGLAGAGGRSAAKRALMD
jgi:2-haloacid dehalogenase